MSRCSRKHSVASGQTRGLLVVALLLSHLVCGCEGGNAKETGSVGSSGAAGQDCSSNVGCRCVFQADCHQPLVCLNGVCDHLPVGGAAGSAGTTSLSGQAGTSQSVPGGASGLGGEGGSAGTVASTTAATGEPCSSPAQCESKICYPTARGGICSHKCGSEGRACPSGWPCINNGTTEFPEHVCQPICVPGAEICNFKDDNCDGSIDEGFRDANGNYTTDANCGACGNDCASLQPNATVVHCELVGGASACVPKACKEGYYLANDACIPVPNNLCQTCSVDADCVVPGSQCLSLGSEKACAQSCATGSPYGTTCPDGYTCIDQGGGISQCRPTSGTCACSAANAGMSRACVVFTCPGQQLCAPAAGVYEYGICSPLSVATEVCNYQDDDCNGQIDETFKDAKGNYLGEKNCGVCGNDCLALNPNAASVHCVLVEGTPACVVESCKVGYYLANGACIPVPNNLCQTCATDQDCVVPGSQCLTLGTLKSCGRSCATGSPFGTSCPAGFRCVDHGGSVSQCEPSSGTCACTASNVGLAKACLVFSCLGQQLCSVDSAGGYVFGVCIPLTSSNEVCNYKDDDCNGLVDETFKDADGRYVGDQNCGACGNDCAALQPNATVVHCKIVDGAPRCVPDACKSGYYLSNGTCLPLPDNLCQACNSNTDCLVPGSQCLTLGTEKACGRSCTPGSPYGASCPAGYACSDLGSGVSQCSPQSGSCICNSSNAGLERPCMKDTCQGKQICSLENGQYKFNACSAEGVIPEVCNQADDNCNGAIDEGYRDGSGRYILQTDCGICGNNCLTQWNPALYHGNVGYCDTTEATPTCRIDLCKAFTENGVTYEMVTIAGDPRGPCACQRVQGNTVDAPEEDFDDSSGSRIYPAIDAQYEDQNCDGIDGSESEALFVSAAGISGGTGTRLNPYPSLATGIAAFPSSGKKYILVANGDYPEQVTLSPGLRLYGGYSLDFRSRNIVTLPTRIAPASAPGGTAPVGTIHAEGITQTNSSGKRTVVSGFTIIGYTGAAATASGASGGTSYAVYLKDCDDSVTVTDNWIVGGRGGSGGLGTTGADGFGYTSSGGALLAGGSGINASACTSGTCAGVNQAGGIAGANPSCPGSNGLAGGSVACPIYNTDACAQVDPTKDGLPGRSWTLDSGSNSSCYGHMTEAGFPTQIRAVSGGDGLAGVDGPSGAQANGCSGAFGTFTAGTWLPSLALNGTSGSDGARGGRGASSGGMAMASAAQMPAGVSAYTGAAVYKLGASGGGSGAGACGGTGGGRGGAGGASLGLVIVFTVPTWIANPPQVRSNLVQRGSGGNAGNGGFGGRGGVGGPGGAGGTQAPFWIDYRGGNGARGGDGGVGGGGGGGCGGASIGIVVTGPDASWSLSYDTTNTFLQTNSALTGGAGGASGPTGVTSSVALGVAGGSTNYLVQ